MHRPAHNYITWRTFSTYRRVRTHAVTSLAAFQSHWWFIAIARIAGNAVSACSIMSGIVDHQLPRTRQRVKIIQRHARSSRFLAPAVLLIVATTVLTAQSPQDAAPMQDPGTP